jgi:hypothetical protein
MIAGFDFLLGSTLSNCTSWAKIQSPEDAPKYAMVTSLKKRHPIGLP